MLAKKRRTPSKPQQLLIMRKRCGGNRHTRSRRMKLRSCRMSSSGPECQSCFCESLRMKIISTGVKLLLERRPAPLDRTCKEMRPACSANVLLDLTSLSLIFLLTTPSIAGTFAIPPTLEGSRCLEDRRNAAMERRRPET